LNGWAEAMSVTTGTDSHFLAGTVSVEEYLFVLLTKYIVKSSKTRAKRNASRILVGKPERKNQLGSLRHRWKTDFKAYLEDWNGFMSLRIMTNGGLLRTQYWKIGFQEIA
jgi:hypothetical protein